MRSKPATGTAPAGAFGTPPTGLPLTGSAMAANMLAMCSSVTRVPASTPLPSSRADEPRADEHARRGTGGGVVTAQGVGALGRPVASGDRLEQVAVSAAQADPADRDHSRLSWPSGTLALVLSACAVRAIGRAAGPGPAPTGGAKPSNADRVMFINKPWVAAGEVILWALLAEALGASRSEPAGRDANIGHWAVIREW